MHILQALGRRLQLFCLTPSAWPISLSHILSLISLHARHFPNPTVWRPCPSSGLVGQQEDVGDQACRYPATAATAAARRTAATATTSIAISIELLLLQVSAAEVLSFWHLGGKDFTHYRLVPK